MPRAIHSFSICLALALVLQACHDGPPAVTAGPPIAIMENSPLLPKELVQRDEDLSSLEEDIELIDLGESRLSLWLREIGGDASDRESLMHEIQLLNAVLVRCQVRMERLFEVENDPRDQEVPSWSDRIRNLRLRLDSRINAIKSLKDELLNREFSCEELDGQLDGAELDAAQQRVIEEGKFRPGHSRKPSSLYKNLV